ncbi:dipeptidase [Leucobacter sp. UCMA 4100]|uniref:dipeptidase n=1 Tax=Leucobacter sp. UCMA 4100 TaxID=2810534 RepID=UPI0022EB93F2|nr:dipeptidase [Leucobacter sp. UCMA 4100]MDA3147856.1 dipeptidase [Leucobacter sp. UCMA 4100]
MNVTKPAGVASPPSAPFIVDGHNDLAWQLRVRERYSNLNIASPRPELHTDLVRLQQGNVGLQFWSAFVPSHLSGRKAAVATLQQIDAIHTLIETHEELVLVDDAEAVRQAVGQGRIAGMIGVEGGHCIDSDLALLRIFRKLGVRYMTLTHNDDCGWAESATGAAEVAGVSAYGEIVIREMNRIGVLVDLSHVSDRSAERALKMTQTPAIFSHSNCQSLVKHPRNVSDQRLLQLRENGGVLMLSFVPAFVNQAVADYERAYAEFSESISVTEEYADYAPRLDQWKHEALERWRATHPKPVATIDDVVDHICHARDVLGIEHVGLGSDFDGVDSMPRGLEDVSCYPELLDKLQRRGWSSNDLSQLAHENVLRVLDENDEFVRDSAARERA